MPIIKICDRCGEESPDVKSRADMIFFKYLPDDLPMLLCQSCMSGMVNVHIEASEFYRKLEQQRVIDFLSRKGNKEQ